MLSREALDILVFKTNIQTEAQLATITIILNAEKRVRRWNIDDSDVDHVLRVESTELQACDVVNILTSAGFICEELPD